MDTNDYSNLTFHPYRIMMTLFLAGLTMLFLALTGSYVYSRIQNGLPAISVPWLFLVNTIVLLASSYTMVQARKFYENDNTDGYKKALLATIFLTLLFMVSQFVAWQMMLADNISIVTSNASGYIYAISYIHLAHVLGGLPFLLLFYWAAHRRMKEPVSVLIYFSDPLKRLKLSLLTQYWHFLDILWIYLVVFFWINSLI
jgi:cytochrome c oxidase subunit 3